MPIDRPRGATEDVISWAVDSGRIYPKDVEYWQQRRGPAERVLPILAAGCAVPVSGRQIAASAALDGPRPVRAHGADPRWYALNPAVDDLRVSQSRTVAAAAASADAPTLFQSGDLPAFCASGIDPRVLADVPWTARHRIAAAPTRGEALHLIEAVSGEGGLDEAALMHGDLENRQYEARVAKWVTDAGVAADRRREAAQQATVMAAAVGASDPATMSDDEVYEHVFGSVDRRHDEQVLAFRRSIAEGRSVGCGPWSGGRTTAERLRP